jgi:hypothetical protein
MHITWRRNTQNKLQIIVYKCISHVWDVMPCSLMAVYWCFEGTACLKRLREKLHRDLKQEENPICSWSHFRDSCSSTSSAFHHLIMQCSLNFVMIMQASQNMTNIALEDIENTNNQIQQNAEILYYTSIVDWTWRADKWRVEASRGSLNVVLLTMYCHYHPCFRRHWMIRLSDDMSVLADNLFPCSLVLYLQQLRSVGLCSATKPMKTNIQEILYVTGHYIINRAMTYIFLLLYGHETWSLTLS